MFIKGYANTMLECVKRCLKYKTPFRNSLETMYIDLHKILY